MKTVVGAFIFEKDKMLVILHKRLQKWMPVAGHVEEGEFFDEALKRECREEVNLDVEIISITNSPKLEGFQPTPFSMKGGVSKRDGKRDFTVNYLVRALNPNELQLQEEEVVDFKWITQQEIDSLATFEELKILMKKAFELYFKL